MDKMLRYCLLFIGIAGILNSVSVLRVSNFNLGSIFPAIAGSVLIIYSLFQPQIVLLTQNGLGRALRILVQSGLILFIASFALCIVILNRYSAGKPNPGADAILVLGAGLHGDQVSQALAYRLDTAASYYFENKDSIMIVSGGQGSGELVTEAEAMKKYLMGKGIGESKILMEYKSTNTMENFQYSKVILDDYFNDKEYTLVYVTNDFHTFRAGLLAEKVGFNAQGLASPSTPYLLPNFYIREYFSVVKYLTLDSWR